MDILSIRVNEKFDLLTIIYHGEIARIKIMIAKIFFMSEAVVQALHPWLKKLTQKGPSKTVG